MIGELVLVGNKIALVLDIASDHITVRKWVVASKSWTQPSVVLNTEVTGRPKITDLRRGNAQRAITKEMLEQVQWTCRDKEAFNKQKEADEMKQITEAQQRVMEYVKKHGKADKASLVAAKLDTRAANNLVKAGELTCTNGTYRAPGASTPPPAKTERAKKLPKSKANTTGKCICGCGGNTSARFLPGHDAKLHSLVVRVHKGEANKGDVPKTVHAVEYLKQAPWMTKEIAATLGL